MCRISFFIAHFNKIYRNLGPSHMFLRVSSLFHPLLFLVYSVGIRQHKSIRKCKIIFHTCGQLLFTKFTLLCCLLEIDEDHCLQELVCGAVD